MSGGIERVGVVGGGQMGAGSGRGESCASSRPRRLASVP